MLLQLRKLVAELRLAYGRRKGSRERDAANAERTAKALDAGRALLLLVREDSDRIEVFLAEDGGVVLLELLREPCSEQVRIPAPSWCLLLYHSA